MSNPFGGEPVVDPSRRPADSKGAGNSEEEVGAPSRDKIRHDENRPARRLLEYLCTFCNLDLFEVRQQQQQQQRPVDGGGRRRRRRRRRLPLWSHLIRLFYVYVTIKTCVSLALQHDYDNCRENLARYISSNNYNILSSTSIDLIDELRTARDRLKAMGAPYMHVYFILECAYIYLMVVVHLAYFQTQLYFHHKPIDYSLYRYILDPVGEQAHIDQLVRAQVDKFIASSRNYALARRISNLHFKPSKLGATYDNVQHGSSSDGGADLAADTSAIVAHGATVRQLRELMSGGHLQPINRSPGEVERVARQFTWFVVSFVLVGLSFVVLVGTILPVSGYYTTFKPELDPLDVLFALELYLSCFIGIHAISTYLAIVVISCVDQIRLVNRISKLIRDCIVLNEADHYYHQYYRHRLHHHHQHQQRRRRHRDLQTCYGNSWQQAQRGPKPEIKSITSDKKMPSPTGGANQLGGGNSSSSGTSSSTSEALDDHRGSSHARRMNTNLLRALIHYKIFVVQLKPLHGSSRFLVMVALVCMVLAPLLGRIYVVYLPLENRILLALSSVLFAAVADVYFTSLCYFHGQCLKLYSALFSLVAHVVGLGEGGEGGASGGHEKPPRAAAATTEQPDHFDPHLIWLIRKELNHPDRLVHQFATTAFGFSVTYPNYVRVHFWVGLLIVSIFTVDSREKVAGLLGESFSLL